MYFPLKSFSFILIIIWNNGLCLAATEGHDPYELAQVAELSYKNLVPGALEGQRDKPSYVDLRGAQVHQVIAHGENGKTVEDFYNPECTGFHAYTIEKDGEVFVAMRGTQNPLHALLDIHIMIEGVGTNPSEVLAPYIGVSPAVAKVGGQAVGIFGSYMWSYLTSGKTASIAVEPAAEESWIGALATSALDASSEVLPEEIKGLYALYTSGDRTRLSAAVGKRFENALEQANECLEQALKFAGDRPIHIIGHSLGGALATVATVKLIAKDPLKARQLDVTTFCSPGSKALLKEDSVLEGLSITNYGRKNDLIHMFGEHVGVNRSLPESITARSFSRLHASSCMDASEERYWWNPLRLLDSGKKALKQLHGNHSIAGVIFDLELSHPADDSMDTPQAQPST
jgi:hypothetical protein